MRRKWIFLFVTVILIGVLAALSASVLAANDHSVITLTNDIKTVSTALFQEIFLPVVLNQPTKYP